MADAISFRPFTERDALTAASWRYPEPYSAYDMDPWDPRTLPSLLKHDHRYHAILRQGEMVGYFCVGKDARVPGWDYDENALDFGMGLRPDLTGKGSGVAYLISVASYISKTWPGKRIRATVAGWNHRAITTCVKAGFVRIAAFSGGREGNLEYLILLRNMNHAETGQGDHGDQ